MMSRRRRGDTEQLRAAVAAAVDAIGRDPDEVIVYGTGDDGVLCEHLLRSGLASLVTVVAADASALEMLNRRARATGGQFRALAADSLDEVPGGQVDATVIAPSGYEGHPQLRRMVQEAAVRVRPGGVVLAIASVRVGANALERLLREVVGEVELLSRERDMRVLKAPRAETVRLEAADAEEDVVVAEIAGRRFEFATQAGIFSRGRIDEGTRLLLESIDVGDASRVLDLGCGYGPIGIVVAAMKPDTRVLLVDVDARAVALARRNAERNDVASRVRAIVADGAAAAGGPFDLALSHFPLHVPRHTRERLVREVIDVLDTGERFCTVALAQYDLRPLLENVFSSVRELADTRDALDSSSRYVVLEASR